MEESAPAAKKNTRTRKTVSTQDTSIADVQSPAVVSSTKQTPINKLFDELSAEIIERKLEFDNLQKEIFQTQQDWVRETKQYEIEQTQQKVQAELERKREEETYQYNTTLVRKRTEDEFQDKKMVWEKELAQKKEELEAQRKELEQLRKQVADFEGLKEKAVKEAQVQLEKELNDNFENGKKLREQEVKAEKDLLNMRISTLESDNGRLNKEIEIFKRSLDEASRQVKEIAVKVIESGSSQTKPQAVTE